MQEHPIAPPDPARQGDGEGPHSAEAAQAEERLLAGSLWVDQDLILTTRTGNAVMPRSFDRTLDVLVKRAGVPPASAPTGSATPPPPTW